MFRTKEFLKNLIVVFFLGAIGAVLRSFFLSAPFSYLNGFPLVTFTINVLGSFLIGVISSLAFKKVIKKKWFSIGLMTGFLGGFTTFSTFCKEIYNLISVGNLQIAIIYTITSLISGLFAAWCGYTLTQKKRSRWEVA